MQLRFAIPLVACLACAGEPTPVLLPKPRPSDTGALVIAIDRSGSMQGDKLEAAQAAAIAAIDQLDATDRVGVIAFDGAPTVLVPLRPAADRAPIVAALSGITAGNGTDLLAGLQAAYDQLREARDTARHVIVVSDGEIGTRGLVELARAMRAGGITLSAVAVPFADERVLEALAMAGGGRIYRVDDLARLPAALVDDVRLALAP